MELRAHPHFNRCIRWCPSKFGGGGQLHIRRPLYENPVLLTAENIAELKRLLISFGNRTESERRLLNRSMQRLSQAKHEGYLGDRFLDLSIALEMLLLNDNTSHVQLALSFRLHGALLIGGDLESRRNTQSLLDELYTHRSAVAHAGKLADKKKRKYSKSREEALDQIFPEFISMGEQIITSVVLNGIPAWNDLRLGASAESRT